MAELRIIEHCKYQGITLQELADKIGVARSTLANTLSKGNPTVETLSKIAEALGVEITELFASSPSGGIIGVIRIGETNYNINSVSDLSKLLDKIKRGEIIL